MKLAKLVSISFLAVYTNSLYAGSFMPPVAPTYTGDSRNEHRAYAGLVWSLKEKNSIVPDLTLGFRSMRIKSNDNITGGDISARIKFENGINYDSTRLTYIGGDRDLQGNIGIGYSNTYSNFLGTFALQVPHLRFGTDFEFINKKFLPYFEVNTLQKPNNVNRIPSCPNNYYVYIAEDKTCYAPI